jgi:spore coat polysaccharide biosynthesis protein SpsF
LKIVATIEARMGSVRLPGKVLLDIGGILSLECQIKRIIQSSLIDEIVLATTENTSDDQLVNFAHEIGIRVFRGSEEDVLSRILGAARSVDGNLLVQITGDCPLIDPQIVDQVIRCYLDANGQYDFVSNEIIRSYPIGLDCRVFPVKILAEVDKCCKDPVHRVHGSTYIYLGEGKKMYRSHNIIAPDNLNYPNWRWTLDTKSDLEFLQKIGRNFGNDIITLSASKLADWLVMNPKITSINSMVRQKLVEEG